MAGAKLLANEVTGIEVVKYPSRRVGQEDRWHVNVGEYDAGDVMYPLVSLFLSREEAGELIAKLQEALA
jgi:hypothetical protein